ncbi:MAG TPA: c-type cytochrome [Gemmatimonadales bacterium]|nr:c-type cytochrome [Gemmatimonadales bacterium]
MTAARALRLAARAALALAGLACRGSDPSAAQAVAALTGGGDAGRGRLAIPRYGCPACHTIPGIPGADGLVGPPLGGIANRAYIGGVLTNTPAHMVDWLLSPPSFSPRTAMPVVGLSPADARDIAAYLYTLR